MRRPARLLWLAAVISISAAAFPEVVAADPTSCRAGAGPVGADPSSAGGVNIHVTANNSVMWCSAAVIQANSDVQSGSNYPLRSTSQSPGDNPVSNAISVTALLTLAGLNPASVNHTEISRLSGSFSTLSNADLVDPSAQFADGLKPIFWINGSETQYLRPLRGPSDTNGNDSIVVSSGSALDLYVYSGPVLTVTAAADPTRAAVNQPITFTAHVVNRIPADGTLIYKWDLQDGTTLTGRSVTHSYGTAGDWYPVVSVQGTRNDSGGASAPAAVTVGTVPKGGDHGKPGGTNRNKHAHTGGPASSNGNTPNVTPTHNGGNGTGAKASSHHQTRATTSLPTASTAAPAAHTTTTASTPAPAAHTTTTASTPAPAAHTTTTPTHATSRKPAQRHTAAPARVQLQSSPGTTVVKGRLVADVIPISAVRLAQENTPAGQASQARAPSAALGGGSVTPLAGVAGGCVIILLLGAGAGSELRALRRSVTPTRAG